MEVKHGVLVNNQLITSHPDVLAAGDVAEHNGVVYGLWTASQAQGAIAGRNLAGAGAEFTGLPRTNTLKVLGLDMFSIGQIMPADAGGQVLEQETEGRYYRFVFHEGRLVGAILLGDTQPMAVTKKAVEEKRDCASVLRGGATAAGRHRVSRGGGASPDLGDTDCRPRAAVPQRRQTSRRRSVGAGRYRCPVCGYVYDEREAGAAWDSLPHDWACPGCGAAKSTFEPLGARSRGAGPGRSRAGRPGPSRLRLRLPGPLCGAHVADGPAALDVSD